MTPLFLFVLLIYNFYFEKKLLGNKKPEGLTDLPLVKRKLQFKLKN